MKLQPDLPGTERQPSNLERLLALLGSWGACEESLVWLALQPHDATLQELWDACPNASWLYWLDCEALGMQFRSTRPARDAYFGQPSLLVTNCIDNPALYRSRRSCPDLSRYGIK